MTTHPSHRTRISDSSNFDEICTQCGANDGLRSKNSLFSPCPNAPPTISLNLVAHLYRARAFSERTFGPGPRTKGVIDHIRKELCEIEKGPRDLEEWIDVAILAFDGAWRTGATPEEIVAALVAKQDKNESRTWPDWRTQSPDKAIEHDRTRDEPSDRVTELLEANNRYLEEARAARAELRRLQTAIASAPGGGHG